MARHDRWYGGWRGSLVAVVLLVAAGFYAWWRPGVEALPEGKPESLRLAASLVYGGSAMVQLAREKDYFRTEGLALELQDFPTGRAALDAVLKGQADLATAADLPIVYSVLMGEPVAIVGTLATSDSGYGVVARNDRGIRVAADLKGKRVGLTAGTSAHFWFDAFLLRQHMVLADVRIQSVAADKLAATLAAGELDAVSTWEPYLGAAMQALGDKAVLLSASGIYDSPWNLAGLRSGITQRPEAVRRLLRALLRAERFYSEEPKAALALIAKARGVDPRNMDSHMAAFRFQLRLEQSLLGSLEDESRWAMRSKLTDASAMPNFLDHLYLDALLQVQPARVSVIR